MKQRLAKYITVRLETDLSLLSEKERQMIPLLKKAARVMDELFWLQACGDNLTLLVQIPDPDARRFAGINYGPWDRLDADTPFLEGFGPKPPGTSCYPMARVAERGRDPTMGPAMDTAVRRFLFPAPGARRPGCR